MQVDRLVVWMEGKSPQAFLQGKIVHLNFWQPAVNVINDLVNLKPCTGITGELAITALTDIREIEVQTIDNNIIVHAKACVGKHFCKPCDKLLRKLRERRRRAENPKQVPLHPSTPLSKCSKETLIEEIKHQRNENN